MSEQSTHKSYIIDSTLYRIHSYIRDFESCVTEENKGEEWCNSLNNINRQYIKHFKQAEEIVNPDHKWRAARGSITRHNDIKNPTCILTDNNILNCSECPWSKTRILKDAIPNTNLYTDASRGTYILIDCDIMMNTNMNETSILTFLELAALLEMKR